MEQLEYESECSIGSLEKIIGTEDMVNAINNGFEKMSASINLQNERLDAHYERINVISDNLNKTHTIVCSNSNKLDKILSHFKIK